MGINQAVWELMQALQGESRAGKKKTHLLLASEAGSPLDETCLRRSLSAHRAAC